MNTTEIKIDTKITTTTGYCFGYAVKSRKGLGWRYEIVSFRTGAARPCGTIVGEHSETEEEATERCLRILRVMAA